MTLDDRPARTGEQCRNCGAHNELAGRFCGYCGTTTGQVPQPRAPIPPRHGPPTGDGTTRYLCAAAQLDEAFADDAISEHLVERTRAVPPSPGVEPAAVLREAVAARSRRRLRDGTLLLLLVIFTFLSLGLAVAWFLVALVTAGLTGGDGRRRLWTVLGVAALGLLAVPVLGQILLLGSYGVGTGLFEPDLGTVLAALVGALVLAVLVADESTVEWLVRTCFRPGSFRPDARDLPQGWERTVRLLGTAEFVPQLDRVEQADTHQRDGYGEPTAEVIVYRDWKPFVGAGVIHADGVVALPLDPGTDAEGDPLTPQPFTAVELHEFVAAAVGELRNSRSLAPSGRLAGLVSLENVVVPVERLMHELGRQPNPPILPRLEGPPASRFPSGSARMLADYPREWARYYRCFRVEAWERDIAMSTFFGAGTDQRMLYLELTQCVLPPLKDRYRAIDRTPVSSPTVRALAAAVLLPSTIPARLGTLFRWFGPLAQRDGEFVPARYGAARSLREQAAAAVTTDFFQQADVERYRRLVEKTVVRAVGRFLEERGYSVVDFMAEVAQGSSITNNQFISNNTISGGQQFVNGGQPAGRDGGKAASGGRRERT